MRLVHILVIAALVTAAAYVYRIKFEATVQAEQLAKLRGEIRRERDAIAALRAEWARLDNPARVQSLARRHLALRPIDPLQYDKLDKLPERKPLLVPPDIEDPIGAIIERTDEATGAIAQGTRP
jgi:cell division protein FtsL